MMPKFQRSHAATATQNCSRSVICTRDFSKFGICTYGIVDDVMFSHDDHMARRVHSLAETEHDKLNSGDNFCSTTKIGSIHCELRSEGKVYYLG